MAATPERSHTADPYEPARVEELTRFGKALDDFPRSALVRQLRIFGAGLRRRYGTLSAIRMVGETVAERRRVRSQHREALVLLEEWGSTAVNEALGMESG